MIRKMGFYYKTMNYEEKPYDDIEHNGLSVDYMALETKRAIADTKHSIQIYPSVDINVPLQPGEKQSTPEAVKAEVSAAFALASRLIGRSRQG